MAYPSFGVTYIRPCVTDVGKVSAETHLAGDERGSESLSFLESSKLCWLLNLSEVFTRVKCSENLGIAKMEFNGKTVVVSKGGRINIRTADDRKDALETTRIVVRAIWPAMICSRCGKAVLDCASGLCLRCAKTSCPLLINGVPDPTGTVLKKPATKTIRKIFAEMEASEKPRYLEARKALDESFKILDDSVAGLLSGIVSDQISPPSEKTVAASRLAQRLITQGEQQTEYSAGLALLGIARNLETLGQYLSLIIKLINSTSDQMALKMAWSGVSNTYRGLWNNDSTNSTKVKSLTTIRKAITRSLKGRRNNDLRDNLENMVEVSVHFREVGGLSVAA